jgi:hypothetical protein
MTADPQTLNQMHSHVWGLLSCLSDCCSPVIRMTRHGRDGHVGAVPLHHFLRVLGVPNRESFLKRTPVSPAMFIVLYHPTLARKIISLMEKQASIF